MPSCNRKTRKHHTSNHWPPTTPLIIHYKSQCLGFGFCVLLRRESIAIAIPIAIAIAVKALLPARLRAELFRAYVVTNCTHMWPVREMSGCWGSCLWHEFAESGAAARGTRPSVCSPKRGTLSQRNRRVRPAGWQPFCHRTSPAGAARG